MRVSFHEPIGAAGILLAFGVAASVVSSAATGRILARARVGPLLAVGTLLAAAAQAEEAVSPSLWIFTIGTVFFGLGFGAMDAALNAHAAGHFGARQINWMHASYGLGATTGPLLVTAILGDGLGWRWTYAIMALILFALGLVLAVDRHGWETRSGPPTRPVADSEHPPPAIPPAPAARRQRRAMVELGALTFTAVETGIESGAGIWGYVFLTAGRGLSHELAGVAVAAYWAMMFVGRVVLGPLAERLGPTRVLAGAVVGVACGAALMTAPASSALAIAGIMTLGVASAPIFPLFTLTTAQRIGATSTAHTTQTVSLQVAASAIGSAVLPAATGIAIGASNANVLAPSLLILSLAMCGVYRLLSRPPRTPTA